MSDETPANKHELAYRLIRERIVAAVYQPGQRLVIDTLAQLDAMRGALFPSVPQRGSDSVAEHMKLIELLEQQASFLEIEAYAREHKLHFLQAAVRQLRQWMQTRQAQLTAT